MEVNKTNRNLKDTLKRVFFEDQYHLGNIDLRNPTKNHYVVGLFPITRVHGEKAEGKIRTIGISSRFKADSKMHIKDNGSYGLIGNVNRYGEGCQVERSTVVGGIFNRNEYDRDCKVEKSIVVGGILNANEYDRDCKVEKSIVVGGITNTNEHGLGCEVERSTVVGGIFNGTEYRLACKIGMNRVVGGILNYNLHGDDCEIKISKAIGLVNFHRDNEGVTFGLLERSIINED